MLTSIVSIEGVGLLRKTKLAQPFDRVNLIYAENGRGKSTIAAIMRSVSENASAPILARSTLGVDLPPVIELEFKGPNSGHLGAKLENGIWSASNPAIQVFDAEFVTRNVYAGSEIKTDQRASLLEFALGQDAVALRKRVDAASATMAAATVALNAQAAVLRARAGTSSLENFVQLPAVDDAAVQIALLERRMAAANAKANILKMKVPHEIEAPSFDGEKLFAILSRDLPAVEAEAEQLVRDHLARVHSVQFESWLSQGEAFAVDDHCPYCGTDTSQNDLIKAYRSHFNAAYGELQSVVVKLAAQVEQRIGDHVAERVQQLIATELAVLEGWRGYLDLPEIIFDVSGMRASLRDLRALIRPLVDRKSQQPLLPVGDAAIAQSAKDLWQSIVGSLTLTNSAIREASSKISTFRKELEVDDVAKIQEQISRLKMQVLRYSPDVVAEVRRYSEFLDERTRCNREKDAARDDLDELMKRTLELYQAEINGLLKIFGSQVQIEDLGFNYRGGGGSPRSDYRLTVRGHKIELAGEGRATFGNALSEGDKRALGFAFFIARLHKDPSLAERIVVIDDPMCSLDRSRRNATIRLLKVISAKCLQLIVLAHDPSFLQAFEDELRQVRGVIGDPKFIKLGRIEENFSDFEALDLARECASQYERDLELVVDYVSGAAVDRKEGVARALRVVVEGSLHRQFPGQIARGRMLGQVISDIDKSDVGSALSVLKPRVAELRSLNDYLSQFHHDGGENPFEIPVVDDAELLAYSQRVLSFVFRG